MFDEHATTAGGEVAEKIKAPLTRDEKIAAWRKDNERAYKQACHEHECTCTPTRAQMLLFDQWRNPPVD